MVIVQLPTNMTSSVVYMVRTLLLILCVAYSQGKCDIPVFDDIDYSAMKDACALDEELCRGCLKNMIDNVMLKSDDDVLKTVIPKIYNVKTQKFDQDAVRECSMPYVPDLVKESVFVPITKAVNILKCDDDAVKAIFMTGLKERNLSYLMDEEISSTEVLAKIVDEENPSTLDPDDDGDDDDHRVEDDDIEEGIDEEDDAIEEKDDDTEEKETSDDGMTYAGPVESCEQCHADGFGYCVSTSTCTDDIWQEDGSHAVCAGPEDHIALSESYINEAATKGLNMTNICPSAVSD